MRHLSSKEKKWRAKWIWAEGEPVPQNFYLYCRKEFALEGEIAAASVDAAADSRYKLFVNGRFVGRGRARCDQRWQYYDTYDIRPSSLPGRMSFQRSCTSLALHPTVTPWVDNPTELIEDPKGRFARIYDCPLDESLDTCPVAMEVGARDHNPFTFSLGLPRVVFDGVEVDIPPEPRLIDLYGKAIVVGIRA